MSGEIWVCGEVLIDQIPTGGVDADGQIIRNPIVGGGPANTAKALAQLGFHTQFIDGISNDAYGQMEVQELQDAGVHLDYALRTNKPSGCAIVTLDSENNASYEFIFDGTATFDFRSEWLPTPSEAAPVALHIGTLVTVIEPGAQILLEWATEVSKFAPVIFDPNIRPSVLGDRDTYREKVEKWAALSTVVKVSIDDLLWLHPDQSPEEVARAWIDKGVSFVVITLGADGLMAIRANELITVPGVAVKVVDTVGAGDTVGAVVTEAVVMEGVDALTGVSLKQMLHRAAKAAAITCSRVGAKPPTKLELEK